MAEDYRTPPQRDIRVTEPKPSSNLGFIVGGLVVAVACFCGLFLATATWARTTPATPTTSPLKRPSHLRLRPLTRLHQPRLTLSPRHLLTLSRLHLLTLSRPLTLSRLRPQIRPATPPAAPANP